jgi:hypothetical protein
VVYFSSTPSKLFWNIECAYTSWCCRILNASQASTISTCNTINQHPNVAMDYSFYGASQQPYQYMGMPPNAFANTGIDLDAMHTVVSALSPPCSASSLQQACPPPAVDGKSND